jgi:sugar phosphate isomerase/epimerase
MKRRTFLKLSGGAICMANTMPSLFAANDDKELFDISLAEWSLVKSLKGGKMTNLDFPRVAKRDFEIDCIEFVDQFFADKSKDEPYLRELKKRAEDEGVKMGLIMLDTNGQLGAADKAERDKSVEKTLPWIDAAKFLGCKAIRVNAYGPGNAEELRNHVAESCARLADYAAERDINVTIENHGRLSSDADWLVSVMRAVNKPNFGTLPDFGNFPPEANRYDAVEKMMPFAKAVSAKSSKFSENGEVIETDYRRMLRIVRDGGYHGYMGVESGADTPEGEGRAIKLTRDLLKKIRGEQAKVRPIFNGQNLDGWTEIEGGEWVVENGILIGRKGKNWSTNPERTGSWLSTKDQYSDFRLELQYAINKGGNSGIFFRSAHEKNPAFTGYEMQIHDGAGRPASKTGPTSIYDTAAPTKNLVRPAGEWNTITIIGRGTAITVEVNGERVIQTELARSSKGYIGLQNHDDRSEVRFKNIRLEKL